ncbi:phosphotransferase [Carboxydothermus ferrireducens]|uniref:Homoserine kinase type II n=2 Tax=Carboxydothermus TaxID=129957 RepID=A0ABX2RBG7_9THEO|nr:phosphotransferase [Carboxydothermus ferrireducens]NYE58517.1 homoserine kinase type II [Carboxydothermus ferrireducens DSM 11255]
MDTAKFKPIFKPDVLKLYEVFYDVSKVKGIVEDLSALVNESFIHNIIEEVMQEYDLGEVVEVFEIFGGYVNRSFGVITSKNGSTNKYFVRWYKKEIKEEEILFEHSLINYAIKNGLEIAAKVYSNKEGKTYVKKSFTIGDITDELYFAVYEYLPGEDKYTWIENKLNDEELKSAAEILAIFHNAAKDFNPHKFQRLEPPINELMKLLPSYYEEYKNSDLKNNIFHDYYVKNYKNIIWVIQENIIPDEKLAEMPVIPVHCDYHPGNLKFSDNKAVGIFDFDWSKKDIRIFDLGLALVYFCSSWDDENDGELRFDQLELFLNSYQNKLIELKGLSPLNSTEKEYLPQVIAAGNMYLIYWCLRSYYGDLSLNVYEYLAYLRHQVKCMYFIEENKEKLKTIINDLN